MTLTATITNSELKIKNNNFAVNVIKNEVSNSVVEGSFYQANPMTIREMVTRKLNKSLCCCLLVTIVITFISYYIAMNYEAKLNKLDNEIVRINTDNQDLQAYLDRFKSFNNVDSKVGEFKLLQKADKVIEVTAINSENKIIPKKKISSKNFDWAIGY
ncbi:hypothetical protein J6G99_08940 [bacterium]|nr:hypothetical protein [bacterium]